MKHAGILTRSTSAVFATALVFAISSATASAEPAEDSGSPSASQGDNPRSSESRPNTDEANTDTTDADDAGADSDSGAAAEESTPTAPPEDADPADDSPTDDPDVEAGPEHANTEPEPVPEPDTVPAAADEPVLAADVPGRAEDNGGDSDGTPDEAVVTSSNPAADDDSESSAEPGNAEQVSALRSDTAEAAPSVSANLAEAEVAIAVDSPADDTPAEQAESTEVPAAMPTPTPIASFVTGLLSLVGLNPSLAAGPVTPPTGNTILLGLLGWVRREIQRTFFNGTPTALPVQISETGAGVVTGNVGAVDPDGDDMRYRVIQQPADGTVTISADGTFVYTPSSTPTADHQVTFRVQVRDVGFHLNLFGINGPGHVEVPVAINVSLNQAPVVDDAPEKRLPGSATGLISGLIKVSDPNDNPLTYTVTDGPAKGTVEVDAYTGAFLYRPTTTAREAAGSSTAGVADKTDSFTVSVSDGAASVTVTTSVDIAPPDNTVVDTVEVGGFPAALAFTTDGSRVLVAGTDGIVTVIDTATNTVAGTIDVGNEPSGIAISTDGSRAYVTNSGSAAVTVLNVATSQIIDTIAVGNNPVAVTLSADGAKAYVVNANSASVSVIDTATNAVVTIAVGDSPQAIALTPDGTKAYVTNFSGRSVSVIDTNTNAVTATVAVSGNPAGVAVSPDGKRAYVTDFADGVLRVIDTAADKTIAAVGVGDNPDSVAVSHDGTRVYVTNTANNTVSVIDTETNVAWATIDVGNTPEAIALSPNGNRVYIANANSGTVSVISTVTAPDPASALLTSTRGFLVYNLSSQAVKLAYYETAERPEGNRPPIGTILTPGQAQRFEVVYNFLKTTDLRPVFETIDGPQTYYYTFMSVGPFAGLTAFCKSSGSQECKPSGTSEGVNNSQMYLLDVPGTVITYDNSAQAQQQAQVLNSLCFEGSLATCEFTAGNQIFTKTPVKVVGSPVINTTSNDQTYNITVSDTRSQTNSVTVTVKVAITFIKDKVNGGIDAAYGHVWTSTHTFQQGLTIKVPPMYESQVSAAQPVYRVYGDFTLDMGNTTWHLTNIYFDTPNPEGGEGAYYISEKPYVGAL